MSNYEKRNIRENNRYQTEFVLQNPVGFFGDLRGIKRKFDNRLDTDDVNLTNNLCFDIE